MPTQYFGIVRAPEQAPICAKVLARLLRGHFTRTELMVAELSSGDTFKREHVPESESGRNS